MRRVDGERERGCRLEVGMRVFVLDFRGMFVGSFWTCSPLLFCI